MTLTKITYKKLKQMHMGDDRNTIHGYEEKYTNMTLSHFEGMQHAKEKP